MAIYKRGREVVLGTTEEQIQPVARAGIATSIRRYLYITTGSKCTTHEGNKYERKRLTVFR